MAERKVNTQGWFWLAPEYFNRWRIFPRAFIIFYFWLAFEAAMWFMGLPNPSPSQAGFAGAIISAGAAWFGLYVNSGTATYRTTLSNSQDQFPGARGNEVSRSNIEIDISETDVADVPTYTVRGE